MQESFVRGALITIIMALLGVVVSFPIGMEIGLTGRVSIILIFTAVGAGMGVMLMRIDLSDNNKVDTSTSS